MRLVSQTASLGQALTKPVAKSSTRYPRWVRAGEAARWLRGEVVVEPTAKMACAVFAISYPRLKKAQARLDRNKHHFDEKHVNGNGTPTLSDEFVERIVVEDRARQDEDELR